MMRICPSVPQFNVFYAKQIKNSNFKPQFSKKYCTFVAEMKKELSILIPAYNYDCTQLVQGLCRQLSEMVSIGVKSEVIVAEDGTSDEDALAANATIAKWEHCRYIRRSENVGRAAIRNFLTQNATYEWLLFLDCDMELPDDMFVRRYLESYGHEVVDGGFGVSENKALEGHNLRYTYEWHAQDKHSVEQRRNNPYRSFRTTNFLVSRQIMTDIPFDERFLHYGYEDVLFGKMLKQRGITIEHIDNPMILTCVESNDTFIDKTEEGLRTLYRFREDLRGYSQLLTFVSGIHVGLVKSSIRLWHRLFGPLERRHLCGNRPTLRIFNIYKVGYYLSLTKND